MTGELIGVTAPSAGVPAELRARLDFAVAWLERAGYRVRLGECLDGAGVVSAPPRERADEFTRMLTDPDVRAVIPPWGGELAVEILEFLDLEAIAAADPTWLIGYSDLSTLLVPLTTVCGVATLHGQNLMDTPYELPEEVVHWTRAAAAEGGAQLAQSATRLQRSAAAGHGDFRRDPTDSVYTLDAPGRWRRLDGGAQDLDVRGRLIGGCVEVLAPLAGSRFGDVAGFGAREAADGLIVYVEAAESAALDIARGLWSLRLAGWFESANAVLVGRSHAPDSAGFTQEEAVHSALGDLGIPVVLDVDCGHVVPQLALINGASARVRLDGERQTLVQTLD